jgi:hypothetical protein
LAVLVVVVKLARGDEWSYWYPLKGIADLHVKTDDGSVRIEFGVESEIEV